jgi:tetratricopeptide (TPR) repeat protein
VPPSSQPITFLIPGQPRHASTRGRVKHAVHVSATRGDAPPVAAQAVPGEDLVILRIADGPELVLHPENARDLLQAQAGAAYRAGAAPIAHAPNEVAVPVQLQWRGMVESAAARGSTRGVGGVLLSAVEVVAGPFRKAGADVIASRIVERVDRQVDAGLYQLSADGLEPLKGRPRASFSAPATDAPLLVLVHGTFSTTAGTFCKLWIDHPEQVRLLFKQYDNRVFGLDHPTLGVSPIANALTLAESVPAGSHLHLLTHSRGGLVAEVLARLCSDPDDGFPEFAGRGYAAQRQQLRTLATLIRKKALRVDRVVRVACPARGTLLASKRIDAYVSVFKWTLELAGLPVAGELLDFLDAVAQRRTDPELMPGLAAQIPDSPLIRWLHRAERRIDGQLRVISGDLQGDSIGSWLKTLLTDAFYWTDHDLVVQTRSMYGGSPREAASTFLLDQGGKVSHFEYFSNERTARAITNALLQERPQEFSVIGPLSWAGQSSTGTRAPLARRSVTEVTRPAVFVLPGILGSSLKVGSNRIWVSWRLVNGLRQLAFMPGKRDRVEPDGLIGSTYDNLTAFLAATHEVIEFPFDWRRPLEDEARRLAVAVASALDAREASGLPVRLVAHSMGGLLARTLQLERPAVWRRMLSRDGARVLMLGTPNGGSFAPMQVLSGDDTFGNLLALVGAPFQEHAARNEMAGFTGLLQLQAGLLDAQRQLSSARTWQRLADEDWKRAGSHSAWHRLPLQLDALRWGVPSQKVLDSAVALRRRLDEQLDSFASSAEQIVLVVGEAPFTPEHYEMTDEGLVYAGSTGGDGRVTLDSARLPGVRAWRVPCDHGKLPDRKEAFAAYGELLEKGTTSLIEAITDTPATRDRAAAAAALTYRRPARAPLKANPPRSERDAVAAAVVREVGDVPQGEPRLRVTVTNGDLTFVRHPLLLGHYRSMRLTGTEHVMDRWIGHAMEQSLHVGTYPDAIGTNGIFINRRANPRNPLQLPRPAAVIVVGLGEEAKLRGADLVRAVRQGVLAWVERQAESPAPADEALEVAATLIGSGGTGISAGQSAQLVAQGVYEANQRLAQERGPQGDDDDRWPALNRVGRLHLIELYQDRASEALRALQLQSESMPGRFAIDTVVQTGTGGLERPVDASYRGTDYDYISALTRLERDGSSSIEFTLDTKRARTEVRAQHTQSALLGNLVALASNDSNTDPKIGRTLFQLLVPIEIEPYLAGSTEMQIEVDSGTAGIPWELLDTDVDTPAGTRRRADGGEPWAVRSKLLRKLRVENPPQRRDAGADASALVIGEPKSDPAKYPPLPGARAEARAVADCLAATAVLGPDRVEALIGPDDPQQYGPDGREVLNALFDRDRTWRIVHIAGHGEPAGGTDAGGVVLSEGFLSAKEISAMRTVPELVFVNCCHLGARSAEQLLQGNYDRARFAAGVAEELISIGVRCVIAAGWAVDDGAASAFATTFYGSLLSGRRFLDAVSDARKAALTFGGNTWAAYQCYGDPDWTFRRDTSDAQRPSLEDQYQAVLSASALERAVATLAVQSEFQNASPATQRDKLRFLEQKTRETAPEWLARGDVAEAFGAAHAAADDLTGAIRWYEIAIAASDGTASLKAAEQLANLRARVAVEAGSPIDAARAEIAEAIRSLERLVSIHPTLERLSFLGSANKRLALLEERAGDTDAETAALERMQEHYRAAETLASDDPSAELFYPALNRMAAEVALNAGRAGWRGLDPAAIAVVQDSLDNRAGADPDFWSIVGQTELRLYEGLSTGQLAEVRPRLEEAWRDLHTRVPWDLKWKSVYDTAHLVLSKYVLRTTGPERDAAAGILALLADLAGVHDAGPPLQPRQPVKAPLQKDTGTKKPSRRPAAKRVDAPLEGRAPAKKPSQRKRALGGKRRRRPERKQVR